MFSKMTILILFLAVLVACEEKKQQKLEKNFKNRVSQIGKKKETTTKFLWRANEFDEEIQDSVSVIQINEEFCKRISESEKAALGLVATFIGSECNWDGEAKEDRSNLKCKILTALNLGYQCSEKHLDFLQKWFKNDKKVLAKLQENCPTIPFTATVQETFDEIVLTTKGNSISVFFRASGVNLREMRSWSWSETDFFELDKGSLKFVKVEKSEVEESNF